MNVHTAIKLPATPDEFLRWNEDREGKREFVEGRIIEMMVNTTLNHARLASALLSILLIKLPVKSFYVTSADYGVKTKKSVRYPDVMVLSSTEPGNSLATDKPVMIAEVLSPSTMAMDFGAKALEYQAFDSLKHYLILSQNECRIWLWSRSEDGSWAEPVIHEEGEVALSAFDVSLDLAALYAGIA
jgi:Uma2 family endonuclease